MQSRDYFDARMARIFEITGAKNDTALARILEIQPQSIAGARKRRLIPSAWIEKVAMEFSVSAHWLLFGEGGKVTVDVRHGRPSMLGDKPKIVSSQVKPPVIPVTGFASCGLDRWYSPEPLALSVPLPVEYAESNLLAVLAVGQSMRPDGIRQGYMLFCDPSRPPETGDAVYVRKTDGTASVKRFTGQDDSWLHLQGWLDPDDHGVQKPYAEKVAKVAVSGVAPVVIVRRKS